MAEEWRGRESKLFEVSDDLGCRDVSWCWSIVFYQVQSQCSRLPGDFGALYASICWQALWRCWFPFPAGLQHLPTVPKPFRCGLLTMILLCLVGQPTCLTWTPYEIYGIVSRERWETVNPTMQSSWRLNSASAVPQADRFHATHHWCCHLPNEPRLSIKCINEHTLNNLNFSFLINLRKYSNILRYCIFDFHEL